MYHEKYRLYDLLPLLLLLLLLNARFRIVHISSYWIEIESLIIAHRNLNLL